MVATNEYEPTFDEFWEPSKWYQKHAQSSIETSLWSLWAAIPLIGAVFVGLEAFGSNRFLFALAVLLYLHWLATQFLVTRSSRRSRERQWHDSAAVRRPTVVTFSEDEVQLVTNAEKIHIAWKAYTDVAESPSAFLLYQSPAVIFGVPKRAFKSEADAARVREMLERHIGGIADENAPRGFPVVPNSPTP